MTGEQYKQGINRILTVTEVTKILLIKSYTLTKSL